MCGRTGALSVNRTRWRGRATSNAMMIATASAAAMYGQY